MSEKILVPVLGESITEATVSKWLKNEGEKVEADEPIVELETDKVNLEVPSPVSGVLDSINSKDGSVVEVGAVLGSVTESDTNTNETEEIKKIEPTIKENNVVKLEPQKELEKIEEPKILNARWYGETAVTPAALTQIPQLELPSVAGVIENATPTDAGAYAEAFTAFAGEVNNFGTAMLKRNENAPKATPGLSGVWCIRYGHTVWASALQWQASSERPLAGGLRLCVTASTLSWVFDSLHRHRPHNFVH